MLLFIVVLCILTSYWVLQAPKLNQNTGFRLFSTYFCWFQVFFDDVLPENNFFGCWCYSYWKEVVVNTWKNDIKVQYLYDDTIVFNIVSYILSNINAGLNWLTNNAIKTKIFVRKKTRSEIDLCKSCSLCFAIG